METPNHYQVLEIPVVASQEQVARAYRQLARRFHPDLQPPERREWAEEQMKRLNEAYEVLHDPDARARYDATAGLRLDAPPLRKRPRKSPGSRFAEAWFVQYPSSNIFARMTSARWRRRTAFARLLIEILVVAFLLVGAYFLFIEWDYWVAGSLLTEVCASQVICAGIWFLVLTFALLKMIPPRS
jgi:curved DNA-binding protein CbpA